jgi:hypothetical protein
MGLCIMALGAAALFTPRSWADALMGLGFGLVQLVFGICIAVRFGG